MAADPSSGAIIGLYDRRAAQWAADRGRDPRLERAWLGRFAAVMAPGSAVLDIGCGSGEPVARYLFDKGLTLTGIDSSPRLIELARRALPEACFEVADMRALSLGRRFAGLVAWHSFFHLAPHDQRAMFPRFAGHAAAGAALMFTSGPEHSEAIGSWRGEPLYHASLDPAEYRWLLDANGFDLLAHCAGDPDCGDACVWLARRRT